MIWRDGELINGQGRFEWSRRLLETARTLSERLCQTTDLEAAQCFIFLAKICQNDLSLHIAYIYIGRAVRIALAMGLNRDWNRKSSQDENSLRGAQTRTWWLIYSLEIELSFALGRPDSLGYDLYHNRPFPLIKHRNDAEKGQDGPEVEIIEVLVKLAKITRDISAKLYNYPADMPSKLQYIRETDRKLRSWLASVPQPISPSRHPTSSGFLALTRHSQYIMKQRLVLGTKYYNIRMLLHASHIGTASAEDSKENMLVCIDSAKSCIDLIYENYCNHDFFRTWWFNSAYTTFASTILLVYRDRMDQETERHRCQELLQKSIEILTVMEESIVACKAAGIIRRCLERLEGNLDLDPEACARDDIAANTIFDDGILELQQSFPFDVANWEETDVFPWTAFALDHASQLTDLDE
ncbi:hypothetical protein ACHAQJ_008920 [Trichoderma viride]